MLEQYYHSYTYFAKFFVVEECNITADENHQQLK